jgi:P27 family predicted phage terminase small subunit
MPKKPGPVPKPPSLKIANGTFQPHRDGVREQIGTEETLRDVPPARKDSKVEYKRRWQAYCKALIDVNVLSGRDLPVIEQLCDAHQYLVDLESQIGGPANYFFSTEAGLKRHPGLECIQSTRKLIVDVQERLGFGPNGRARVPAVAVKDESDSVGGVPRKATS